MAGAALFSAPLDAALAALVDLVCFVLATVEIARFFWQMPDAESD